MSKINATPALVDIYTYLTAIGVPFNEIADIMVTDSLQFLTRLGETDIFDNSSLKYKVKDMINYYVGKELKKGIQRAPIITYLTLKNNVGKTILENKDLLMLLQDSDRINRALNSLYKSLQRYSNLTDDELDRITQEYDFLKEVGALSDSDRNIIVEPYSLPELRNAIKFLELTKEMLEYRANSQEFDKMQKLANVFNGVDEMSAIGRTFGINQGMPTSLYKLRGAIDNLKQNVPGFDFDLFVTDDSYRTNLIQDYNPTTFNIPDVISTVPHFWEMLKTMYYAEQMLKEFSIKNRTVWNLADEIELANSSRNYHMSEKEFKSLQDYVNDVLIATFLKESQFEVFIAPDVKLITSITGNKNYSLETRKLRLDSAINVAAFKNWMDTYVIPMIIKDYAGNAFVDNLRPLANVAIRKNRETELTGWRFPFNLTEADKSPTTQQLYGSILKGFNEIANQGAGLFGQTIGDLLYVYNMIVNKDSFGQNAFTKIFEDAVQNNPESVVNKYNEYISLLDDSSTSQLNVTVKEAQRRIVKDNPDSYLQAIPSSNLGADFVLDLQDFYNLPNGEVISPEKLNTIKVEVPEYKYTLDPQAIVVEMVKQLNSRLPDSKIHLITDDELVDFKDLQQYHDIIQSRGFILNGEMYINVSRASGATLIHEFSHLVLAGLKANPEKREWYYQLVTSVKNIPNFEEFAAMYPNHVGSDLYEEVFATILESYLDNKQYLPSDYSDDEDTNNVLYALNLNNKEAVLQALSYLFGLDEGIKNLQDIIDKPLEELLDRFGHNLLNSSVPITKAVILDSQKQNTVKQELFKDNKLNMKCDE